MPGRARSRRADGGGDARPRGRTVVVVAAARPRPGFRGGDRAGLRDAGAGGVPRAVRLRGHRHGHQPRCPTLRGGGRRPGAGDPQGPGGCGSRDQQECRTPRPSGFQPTGRGPRDHRCAERGGGPVTTPQQDPSSGGAPGRTLDELDEPARNSAFDNLQARMPQVWRDMRRDEPDESVVVVPSMTVDRVVASSGGMNQALEERFLFLLLLLRQPRLRMVYVTSMPINPLVVEYYLSMLPGVIPSHARARLSLVAVGDPGPEALTEKLLARPRVLSQVRSLIPNRARSHLIPYNTTELERDLALVLGIPMYGADPRLFPLGTKTGCRRLFGEAGVSHPAGYEDLHSRADLQDALRALRRARPGATGAMVKLNEGVSGAGNALVRLEGLPPVGAEDEAPELSRRVDGMELEDTRISVDAY